MIPTPGYRQVGLASATSFPVRCLTRSSSPDILEALRPDLDVQINLRAGIRLQYSQWLVGFPPTIRLVGVAADEQPAVTIDGNDAVRGTDGALTATDWDQAGEHLISCEALTRTYSLIAPPDSWEAWPAHPQNGNLAMCGAGTGVISAGAISPSVVVPATNRVLLGEHPGQIYFCTARSGVPLGVCVGTPPFHPIWAVPALPFQAKKSISHIISLDLPAALEVSEQSTITATAVRRWSQVILDCARKGLRLSEESPKAMAAWRACRDQARAIWRRAR